MHLLRHLPLLTLLAHRSQAVALAAAAPAEDLETLALLLNNTNTNTTHPELANRQAEITNAATLFAFVGPGCNTAGGIQSWTLWLGRGCQAVSNVGSAAWTEKAPG